MTHDPNFRPISGLNEIFIPTHCISSKGIKALELDFNIFYFLQIPRLFNCLEFEWEHGSTTADMMSSPLALHCGCCADNDDGDDDKNHFHNDEYGDDEDHDGEGGDDDNNTVLVSTTMQLLCATWT